MATLDPNWLKTALEVTGNFETDGNPWAGISNDFDQQGISCGILQWNIGQGSLQPLVKGCGSTVVHREMPLHGDELLQACNGSIPQGLTIVRTWQPGGNLKSDVMKELRALFGAQEMVAQQVTAAKEVGQQAFDLASRWAMDLRAAEEPSLREFCWFFDLVTQSHSMKGVWLDDVQSFIAAGGRDQADDRICEWMTSRPPTVEHRSDAKKNAALWKNNVPDDWLELFVLTYLRSLKSKEIYQLVTTNRRGTITTTRGWVNSGLQDLKELREEET